jgi:hypothetical protein
MPKHSNIIDILSSEGDCNVNSQDGYSLGVGILKKYNIVVENNFKSIYFADINHIVDNNVSKEDVLELKRLGWFYYKREDAIATFI